MSEQTSRDRILDAALTVIAGDGFDAASVRRIGKQAGLHNSSIFHHFAGKAAIHDALAGQVVSAARDRLIPPLSSEPPRVEDLIAGLGDLAEHLASEPRHASYLGQILSAAQGGALASARRRATEELLRPLWEWVVRARDARAIRPVRPQPATLQLLGLVLLEPAYTGAPPGGGLRPAARARRREIEAWVRATLARR